VGGTDIEIDDDPQARLRFTSAVGKAVNYPLGRDAIAFRGGVS
jgi:hypothetical protein